MNLNLITAEQQPLAVVNILRQSGALVANDAIQSIADTKGDKTARELVARLPIPAIVEIVKEFDYTKSSIVGDLMTPAQLRHVLERLPLHRKQTVSRVNADSDASDLLCAVILSRKEENTHGAYFRELGKSKLCILALATAFPASEMVCYARSRRFTPDGDIVDEVTVKVGEWEELLFTLRKSSPTLFNKVLEEVRTYPDDLYDQYFELARNTFQKELTNTVDEPYADIT